jgi:hypothetical protein
MHLRLKLQRLKLQPLVLLRLPEVSCSMDLSRLEPDHRESVLLQSLLRT